MDHSKNKTNKRIIYNIKDMKDISIVRDKRNKL